MDKLEFLRSKGVDVDTAVENMMGEDIYNEMIAEFLNALPDDMTKLEEAKNNNDLANYGILAHALKSNARSFGFTDLGNMAYDHEMAGKGNDQAFIDENYDFLVNAVNSTKEIISTYINM